MYTVCRFGIGDVQFVSSGRCLYPNISDTLRNSELTIERIVLCVCITEKKHPKCVLTDISITLCQLSSCTCTVCIMLKQ